MGRLLNVARGVVYVQPPAKARKLAQLGLDARDEAPKSKKCCLTTREAGAQRIGSGIARARDIIAGKRVDAAQVKAYFDRHEKHYKAAVARAKKAGLSLREAAVREPAIQGWWVWGGDPMRKAAANAIEKHEREGNPLELGSAPMGLTRYQRERDWFGPTRWTDVHEELCRWRYDPSFHSWLAGLFEIPLDAQGEPPVALAEAIEQWGQAQWGMAPATTLDLLGTYWSEAQPLDLKQPSIIIPASLLAPGMRIKTPDFARAEVPDAPPSLIVQVWDLDDGESWLAYPDGTAGFDYNTADYPEFVILLPTTHGSAALALVDRHRAALGMAPLDPAASGWTEEDVEMEAQRIRRLSNPSTLEVVYDGRRRGREMVYIEPHSAWGSRVYGLAPTDDYSFGTQPQVGMRYRLVVSDATYGRLVRQRDLRASHRPRRRRY